jgi:hypothetical protein
MVGKCVGVGASRVVVGEAPVGVETDAFPGGGLLGLNQEDRSQSHEENCKDEVIFEH